MILCAFMGLSAQTMTNLAYFPFTGNQQSPNTPTSYLAAAGTQAGTAGLYLDGTHGSSAWLQASELTSNGGSAINALNGEAPGQDLATINNSANGKSIVFHFSTLGFQQVNVSMATRRSGQGFNSTVWSYSTDGENFTVITGASTVPSASATYELHSVDLAGITALNEQANVYLKCTYDGAQSASASFRIDNVQINAYPSGPDTWAPYITGVNVVNETTVAITFNEELSATTAQNVSNYTMDNNVSVTAATLNNNVVNLTVNPQLTEGNTYRIIVDGVSDLAGNVMEYADTLAFTYGVSPEFNCATIADLRSKMDISDHSTMVDGTVEYKLTGEVVVTAVATHNNQKVIQDETGAILIYDPGNALGALEIGDKVKDIYGTLTNYYGFLEFKPTQPYGTLVSMFEDVTPLTITLAQLNDQSFMIQHQAELIKLNGVTFTSAGQFATLTTYEITQNGVTAPAVYPYFQDANTIGQDIPSGPVNITGFNFSTSKIGSVYPDYGFRYYIVPRSMNDFTTGINNYVTENDITIAPNPAVDNVNVTVKNENFQVSHLYVVDMAGRVVNAQNVQDNNITLDVNALSSGMYFLRLTDGKNNVTTKFIKK